MKIRFKQAIEIFAFFLIIGTIAFNFSKSNHVSPVSQRFKEFIPCETSPTTPITIDGMNNNLNWSLLFARNYRNRYLE